MGDVILTSPVVRTVHNQLNCEIHFLIKDSFRDLVKHSPFVHSVHSLSESLGSTISELQKENFDLILDLQKNRKSKKITKELNTETLTFSKLNVKKWILVQSGINLLPKSHLIDRYFDSLKDLGIKNDGLGNELFIPSSASVSIDKLALPKKYIALGIGAQHTGKCLNEEQLLYIAENTSLPIVLLGGKRELELSKRLSESSNVTIWNLTAKSSLLETAEVIRRSTITISGDTGVMHMASAFKVPQISIWGCTSPELGMFPYQGHAHSVIIEPLEHLKRPCAKLGNRCKYAPNWCIQSISPSRITEEIELILKKECF